MESGNDQVYFCPERWSAYLVKTKDGLDRACEFLSEVAGSGGQVLFVGTKRQAAEMVREAAIKCGMPYMTTRWIGGLLTNWSQVGGRIRKMIDLKDKREKGELKKYTKREQLLIDREIGKLEKFFGGVANMPGKPAALFVVDTHREDVAVREAIRMHVPVVGMVDTNANPVGIEYVIPVNDDAVKAIEIVVGAVRDAILNPKKPSPQVLGEQVPGDALETGDKQVPGVGMDEKKKAKPKPKTKKKVEEKNDES